MKTLAKISSIILFALCLLPVVGRGDIIELDTETAHKISGMDNTNCICGCYKDGPADCIPEKYNIADNETTDCQYYSYNSSSRSCLPSTIGGNVAGIYKKVTKNPGKNAVSDGTDKSGNIPTDKQAVIVTRACVIVTAYKCGPVEDKKAQQTNCGSTGSTQEPHGTQWVGSCDAC